MIQKLSGDKTNSQAYLSSQNSKYAKTKQYVYAHVEHARQYAKPYLHGQFPAAVEQIHVLTFCWPCIMQWFLVIVQLDAQVGQVLII